MPLKRTDKIIGARPGFGAVEAQRIVGQLDRPDDKDRKFADWVVEMAPAYGVDPLLVLIQWLLETANATSTRWNNDLNSAGIGIVAAGTVQPVEIPNVEQAAHFHLQCLYSLVNRHLHTASKQLTPEIRSWLNSIWVKKVQDPDMPSVVTVHDLGLRYLDSGVPRATWSYEDGQVPMETYGIKLQNRGSQFASWASDQPAGPVTVTTTLSPGGAITFGRVPKPKMINEIEKMARKPEGKGWNNLGQREPWGIVLHRMIGSLRGTSNYFAMLSTLALTDLGLGIEETDGNSDAGVLLQWTNFLDGYRSGWASGPVSAPYGDGKKFVDKYGINRVNRNLVSIEVSGNQTTPMDAKSWAVLVQTCAWIADLLEIPYHELPFNRHTGMNLIFFHEEFTLGTGKTCPFSWLKSRINILYQDIANYMRPYQLSGGTVTTAPPPVTTAPPAPQPEYAVPVPVPQLIPYADDDTDRIAAVVVVNGENFIIVNDIVRAKQNIPRYQRASLTSRHIGPPIEKGEEFEVRWLFDAGDGRQWYLTPYWTRVPVEATERVKDAPPITTG